MPWRTSARATRSSPKQVRMLNGERHARHNKARVRHAWDARLEAGRVQRSASSHAIRRKDTHGTIRPELGARMGCAARSRQGSAEWVSEQRAHSIGLAAAAVLVAPLWCEKQVPRTVRGGEAGSHLASCAYRVFTKHKEFLIENQKLADRLTPTLIERPARTALRQNKLKNAPHASGMTPGGARRKYMSSYGAVGRLPHRRAKLIAGAP